MNEYFMKVAYQEAKKAFKKGEIPVGAVIVKNNKIISKAHNTVEKKNNALNHAEILAISKASKKLKNWRLIDCEIYVTLEPCDMCKNAIISSRIKNVYYSVEKTNNQFNVNCSFNKINLYTKEVKELIKIFFKQIR